MNRLSACMLAAIFVAAAGLAQTPAQNQNPSTCSLTPAQSPSIRGIKLGMSTDQILSIFPESSQRPEIKAALGNAEGYPHYGVVRLSFKLSTYPSVAKDRFAGVQEISVVLFDSRVTELGVFYEGRDVHSRGPSWFNVDDFIAKLSEAFALAPARDWLQNGQNVKTLKCSGMEIEASIVIGGGSISVRNTGYKDVFKERVAADEEKRRSEFKP